MTAAALAGELKLPLFTIRLDKSDQPVHGRDRRQAASGLRRRGPDQPVRQRPPAGCPRQGCSVRPGPAAGCRAATAASPSVGRSLDPQELSEPGQLRECRCGPSRRPRRRVSLAQADQDGSLQARFATP
ncbi:hypothetical protein [Streptomyces cyaneofuscatus]|uniref:hypothetical protein n=1 Tax=Streptomyces cyaneofuscatus TaxID=66883 RepID=UPI0036610DE0